MAEDTKVIVQKMQAAFDEFAGEMAKLEKQANGLMLKSLQDIDKEKIAAALKDVRVAAGK